MSEPPFESIDRKQHRFILRVWREPSDSPASWRGNVYDVFVSDDFSSGRLPDLWDFIMLRIASRE